MGFWQCQRWLERTVKPYNLFPIYKVSLESLGSGAHSLTGANVSLSLV